MASAEEDEGSLTFAEVYDKIFSAAAKQDEENLSHLKDLGSVDLLRKVQAVSNRIKVTEIVGAEPGTRKSKADCLKVKEEGTRAFRDKNYQTALRLYSRFVEESSFCRDVDSTDELRQAGFANRSAVLHRAGLFRECLQDVEAALELSPYPGEEHLLLDRRARCQVELEMRRQAAKSFADAAEAAGKKGDLDPRLRDVFVKQIRDALEKLRQSEAEEEKPEPTFIEKAMNSLRKGHSKQFDSLSAKVSPVFAGPDRGRILEASQAVRAGEVVAAESAIVGFARCFVSGGKTVSAACHHCLATLSEEVFYPSTEVDGIRFCTPSCYRNAMQKYHKHESHVLSDYLAQIGRRRVDSNTSGCLFLSFKAVLSTPYDLLKEELDSDVEFGTREGDRVEEGDAAQEWRFLSSLVGHERACSVDERLRVAVRAATLVACLKITGYFGQVDDAADEAPFVLLRRLYETQFKVAHNVHTVYAACKDEDGGHGVEDSKAAVGSAVYRAAVMSNHSCCCNTTKIYSGGKLLMVAKAGSIPAGAEVTNNYGPHHSQMPRDERKERLATEYKFECGCDACQKDFPALNEMPSDLPKGLSKQLDKCLANYRRAFKAGAFPDALSASAEYLKKLDGRGVKPPHRNLAVGEVALESCLWALV